MKRDTDTAIPKYLNLSLRRPHKWDGTRLLVDKENEKVTLWNRKGIDYTRRLPEVVEAAKHVLGDFTIDTEVVYINPKTGKEEFTPCQSL